MRNTRGVTTPGCSILGSRSVPVVSVRCLSRGSVELRLVGACASSVLYADLLAFLLYKTDTSLHDVSFKKHSLLS
jgi:hypothetical protein